MRCIRPLVVADDVEVHLAAADDEPASVAAGNRIGAKEAVPALVDNIKFNDEIEDNLTIARLGAITKHPDGYKFLRRWFDNSIQQEAVHAYRTWIEDHLR